MDPKTPTLHEAIWGEPPPDPPKRESTAGSAQDSSEAQAHGSPSAGEDVSWQAAGHPAQSDGVLSESDIAEISAVVDHRIALALDRLKSRNGGSPSPRLDSRIAQAVEALENRLSHPVPTVIPDLMVLERLDQLEARISSGVENLSARLSSDLVRGDTLADMNAEITDKLQDLARFLGQRIREDHREMVEKLDAYQTETSKRLDEIETALRDLTRL